MPAPDLLCPGPALRLDAAELRQTLTFAFASGAPSAAFVQILATQAEGSGAADEQPIEPL
jgi:hypothetical protein